MIEPITDKEIEQIKSDINKRGRINNITTIITALILAIVFATSTIIVLKWHTFSLLGVLLLINLISSYANRN